MAESSREIKRRIKSVKNIGQITKAMELVSAAKMRKAQQAAAASRSYSKLTSELLTNLLPRASQANHPLLKRVVTGDDAATVIQKHRSLIILLSSDKGLAGPLNANVISQALKLAKQEGSNKVDFIAVGKKGLDVLKRTGQNIVGVFNSVDRNVSTLDARPIIRIAINDFLNFTYDKVFVVYTDFISTLVQKPNVLQILPLTVGSSNDNLSEYAFEPDPDEVMDNLIQRYIEFALFQCMQEAIASEHSARMVAMRNANQSASDLTDDLTLSANQARQAGITRELSEISAAKIAMEG